MHDQANHDPLTGLGNRALYEKHLANYAQQSKVNLSVIMIDLDEFKKINDIYGHQEGDKVLRFFAQQLEIIFEGIGLPLRLGGDEFIVLLKEKSKPKLEQSIETLNNNIDQYNKNSGSPYQLKYSYGIAIFDNSFANIYEFIHHSDKLMYEAKQKKKQIIEF